MIWATAENCWAFRPCGTARTVLLGSQNFWAQRVHSPHQAQASGQGCSCGFSPGWGPSHPTARSPLRSEGVEAGFGCPPCYSQFQEVAGSSPQEVRRAAASRELGKPKPNVFQQF